MGLILGSVSALDLILDGQSVSLYAGGNPPVKVWPTIREVVQITLGTGAQARDQFRAALSGRGMNYQTVEEIPFDIELVGTGSTQVMFYGCAALTTVPEMDTSSVTNMNSMFYGCSSLTHVPDMDTSGVTSALQMFSGCMSLTDGNVRLIGKHPNVNTSGMIAGSGLTRLPFLEMVQITLGTSTQARDQFRAALADRGMDYQTVTKLPFGIELVGSGSAQNLFHECGSLTSVPPMDTSSVTRMGSMFANCASLTSAPKLATSAVTNMSLMFYGCSSLTSAPNLDTSAATNMMYMFYNCRALTHVPDMDTSKVTNMNQMFWGCRSLTDGNVRLIGRHTNVTTSTMISGSGLTRLPFYDTDGNPI